MTTKVSSRRATQEVIEKVDEIAERWKQLNAQAARHTEMAEWLSGVMADYPAGTTVGNLPEQIQEQLAERVSRLIPLDQLEGERSILEELEAEWLPHVVELKPCDGEHGAN